MMKRKIQYILFASVALLLVACQPEPEETPQPTDNRDNFEGSWTCAEKSKQNGSSSFTVHITKSTSNTSQVTVENFYNYGFNKTLTADISGKSIDIPLQTFSVSNKVSGSGSLSGSSISMNYIVDDGSGSKSALDTCTAVLTKQ